MSQQTIETFFAYAPLALGLAIYFAIYFAKRREVTATVPSRQTFACASCGRRSIREHMLPQNHDGAVSWSCAHCAR